MYLSTDLGIHPSISDNKNIRPIIFNIISTATSSTDQSIHQKIPTWTVNTKSTAFLYYHAFSRISYYFLMSPCKTILKKSIDEFGVSKLQLSLQSQPIQKVLCGILNVFALCISTSVMYQNLFNRPKTIQEDPSTLFDVWRTIIYSLALWNHLYICWFKRDGLRHLYTIWYQFSSELKPDTELSFIMNKKFLTVYALFCVCIYLSTLTIWSGIHAVNFPQIVQTIKINYLFMANDSKEDFQFGILEFILSALIFLIIFYISILSHTVLIIFPYMTCLATNTVGRKCSDILKQNTDLTFNEVVSLMSEVRELMSNVNSVTGKQIFLFVANAMINLTSALTQVLDAGDVQYRFSMILYSTGFLVVIILTADSTSKIQELSDYVYHRRTQSGYKDNLETLIVMSELSSNPIGIKAFKFPVTFGFIATILSTVLTYTVILVQFTVSASAPVGGSHSA